MKKNFSLVAALCFFCFYAAAKPAKEITIQGTAESFSGKEIRAYLYTDMITYGKQRIASAKVNEKEEFQLTADLEQTEYLILKIEDKSTALLVSPGKVYNLTLAYSKELNKDRIYDKKLSLRFSYPQPEELNQLVKKFNGDYEGFLSDHYKDFARKNTGIISKFRKKMLEKYEGKGNQYFRNYIVYSLAGLEEATKKNEEGFYREYIRNKPVLFRHIEYMRFFNQLYEEKFKSYVISTDIGLEVMGAINYYNSYDSLSAVLKKKAIMENDTIRQMVVLKGLKSLYHNNQIQLKQKKILSLLEKLEQDGICAETRLIAGNVIDELTHFDKGTTAPGFKLKNGKGEPVSLEDFRGKYVYLTFWATWNVPSLKEMKLLQKLHEKYGGSIAFVSISSDNSYSKMTSFLKENDYEWTFLYAGKNADVIEKYEAGIIPRYFLIDPEGKFHSAPAERPTGNIEKEFYTIVQKGK